MASAISKQEIRRNPLAEWMGATVRFVQAHRVAVVAAAVALGIGASVVTGYWWHQQRQEEDASRLLGNALAAVGGERPGSSANPEEFVKLFQEVVKRFPKTRSAEEALIAMGNLQYGAGKMDEALTSFSQYLTTFPRGRFTIEAGLGMGYAQEAKGDFQGAAQTLSQILGQGKNDPLAGEAYMSIARVYEEMKKSDDAMRVYEQVVDRYPQSQWAQHALQRMSALKSR